MHKKQTTYVSPQAREMEAWMEDIFLKSSFPAGGSSSDIDDLGETDTDAGSAIWS